MEPDFPVTPVKDDKPDTSSGQGLSGIIAQGRKDLETYKSEMDKALAERQKTTAAEITDLQKLSDQHLAVGHDIGSMGGVRAPRFAPIPQPPQQKYADPIEAYSNPLVVLATLGSLFTRTPAIAALNAGAAAMNGFHEGQKDQFELQRENFQEKLKTVMAQNQQELQLYDAAIENKRLTISERMAHMSAIANAFQNRGVLAALQQGDHDAAIRQIDAYHTAAAKLNELSAKQIEFEQKQEEIRAQHEAQHAYQAESLAIRREARVTAAQGIREATTKEAKDEISALEAGSQIVRGGVTITPDDWKKFKEGNYPVLGSVKLDRMKEISKSASQTFLPGLGIHGPGQPQAKLDRSALVATTPVPLPPEAANLAEGTPMRIPSGTGKIYIKHGNMAVPATQAEVEQIAPQLGS